MGFAPVGFGVNGYTTATSVKNQTTGASHASNLPQPNSEARTKERDKPMYNPLPMDIVHNHVNIENLELYLRGHPQPLLVKYVLTGLRTGFDLGYNGPLIPVHRRNNKSAREHHTEVSQAIAKELTRGHKAGPFPYPPSQLTMSRR